MALQPILQILINMFYKIAEKIDYYLDRITMYRLLLYVLIALVVLSSFLGIFNLLPYSFFSIILSATFLVLISWISNEIFSKTFNAPINIESVYITALILALIISPAKNINDYLFLAWAAIIASASKYILVLGKKHIFNPVVIAVFLTSLVINRSASWWVGTTILVPFVFVGGALVVKKTRRVDMVYGFILTVLIESFLLTILKGSNVTTVFQNIFLHTSLFFFAFIMLTEPLTSPSTKKMQIFYAILVGILYSPQFHIGSLYFTPESALIIGNIFTYIVNPKEKLLLYFDQKYQIAPDVYDFIFKLTKIPSFIPGQYMEWTLPHKNPDERGNRRYFTIASSPTENTLRLGIKFYQNGSSYKKAMLSLDNKTPLIGNMLAGDFVLPNNKNKKLVFVAGGIGITPFRSIIKYLIDKNESRNIILFYSNKYKNEIVYEDVFESAQTTLGIKTVYTLSDTASAPSNWLGKVGRINGDMIKTEVPDYLERTFYLSGPHIMVTHFQEVLKNMGIKKNKIKTDFFPGFV